MDPVAERRDRVAARVVSRTPVGRRSEHRAPRGPCGPSDALSDLAGHAERLAEDRGEVEQAERGPGRRRVEDGVVVLRVRVTRDVHQCGHLVAVRKQPRLKEAFEVVLGQTEAGVAEPRRERRDDRPVRRLCDLAQRLDAVAHSAVGRSDEELADGLVDALRTGERSNGREAVADLRLENQLDRIEAVYRDVA